MRDRGPRQLTASGAFAVLIVACCPAFAGDPVDPPVDTSETPDPVPVQDVDDDDANKVAAGAALKRGLDRFASKDYDAALAEFVASRELYKARGNTLNAALALRELGRLGEALNMFEALLRDFPELDAKEKNDVQRAIKELRPRVGSIEVIVDEPGAKVIVDGRTRATTPVSGAIRVTTGSHLVRVVKNGHSPLEERVDVASGQTVPFEGALEALAQAGILNVRSSDGRPAKVLIDNVEVGAAPWEGRLGVGTHMVRLEGEGQLGTQPAAATVSQDRPTSLTLELEPLACELRVAPTPVSASVAVDGVAVGNGWWEGRLRCGGHRIEVADDGFLTKAAFIDLTEGALGISNVTLDRDPASEMWRKANPPRIVLDITAAAAVSPSFGGDLADSCVGSCSASVPFGGMASVVGGYQLSFGIGFGVHAGYLGMVQSNEARPINASQLPSGTALSGEADDSLTLQGALLGGSLWFRRGDALRITTRLNAGVFLGALKDTRTSRFNAVTWELPSVSTAARYVYIAPEIRFGWGVTDFLSLDLLVAGNLLVAIDKPTFTPDDDLFVSELGFVGFAEESLAGDVMLAVSPGLGASFSFY